MHHPMEPRSGSRRRRTTASVLVGALLAALLALVPGSPAVSAAEGVSSKGTLGDGYFFVATDGGIFNFGDSEFKGSTGDIALNKPIVGAASTPTGEGYYLVASDGGIFTFGDAVFRGSMGGSPLNSPIVAMAVTPSGDGYWLFAADGGVFTFGDAVFHGSEGARRLNQPIVGADVTPDGGGYYLVARDGGIFTHGSAAFYGSQGGTRLNQPIVGMAVTDDGNGYYLVASDGGIFTHGRTPLDAPFFGSEGARRLNQPIVGMDLSATNQGYYLVAADGGIFTHGDAEFLGSTGAIKLNKPIVGMAVTPVSPITAPDFVVNLRGTVEVPGPGDPDGKGFALVDLSDDEVCLVVKVDGIDPATLMHIHEGPAGQAGPVVIDLMKPEADGTSVQCAPVAPALAARVAAAPENFYVNIHNAAFPGGAVRGQLAGHIGVAATSTGKVVVLDTENPGTATELFSLPASVPAAAVVGHDFRPKTGEAYVLVRNGVSTLTLVKVTPDGTATPLGANIPITPSATAFGIDFNPTNDRIRIVSDADDSLQVDPATGALIQADPALAGLDGNPNVVGAAYTRNFDQTALDASARATGLWGIDSDQDKLTQITFASGAVADRGDLGVDLSALTSFDIAPSTAAEPVGGAFVAATRTGAAAGNQAELFAANLSSTAPNVQGRLVSLGTIGDGSYNVVAFSIFG
jgi:hypothetical protein